MNDSLEHGIFGWTKKDHKYIKKEKGKNGKWKYFYNKVSSAVKKATSAVSNAVSKFFGKDKDKKVDEIKVSTATKKKVDTIVKTEGKNTPMSAIKAAYKKVTMRAYKYIAKVPRGNGKFRYFYTQKEYDSYLNRQKVLDKDYDFMERVPAVEKLRTPQEAAEYVDVDTELGNCSTCSMAFELQMRGYDVKSRNDVDGKFHEEVLACFTGFEKDIDEGNIECSRKYAWHLDLTKEQNKNYYSKGFLGLKKTSEAEQLQIAKRDLEDSIKERGGNNQRGFITTYWSKSDPDENGKREPIYGGHIFNYVVDNGEVKFYDSQKSRINNQTGGEIDITTYLDNIDVITSFDEEEGGLWTAMQIYRTDDKDLNEECKNLVSYHMDIIHENPQVIETDIYLPDKEANNGQKHSNKIAKR